MIDREKVINELVSYIENALSVDSDYVDCIPTDLLQYAVALLKADQYYRQALNAMNKPDDVCKSCQEFTCDDCKIREEKHRRTNDD